MQLVNSGCLNMFNYIQNSWLKCSFLESLASFDWLLYPTENELSGSRNSEWYTREKGKNTQMLPSFFCYRTLSFDQSTQLTMFQNPWEKARLQRTKAEGQTENCVSYKEFYHHLFNIINCIKWEISLDPKLLKMSLE